MRCPSCHAEMRDGTFSVESTVLRFFLAAGWSWESLWFRPHRREPNEKRKLQILDHNVSRGGHLCPSCGMSVLVGSREDSSNPHKRAVSKHKKPL